MPALVYFIGFGLFVFTRTTTYIPMAIIVAPVFILNFLRGRLRRKGILPAVIGFFLSIQLSLFNLYDLDGSIITLTYNLIRNLMLGTALSLPYIVDRLVSVNRKSFISTLIFPMAASSIYFLLSLGGPFAGTGILYAYTQSGNGALEQLLSFFGVWGMVFLYSWISSVAEWIWSLGFHWESVRRGFLITLTSVLVLFFLGGLRCSPFFYDYTGETVRTAAVVFNQTDNDPSIPELLDGRHFSPLDETLQRIEQLVEEASSRAEIIAFQEYTLMVREADEMYVQERLSSMARENGVYLAMSYVVMPELLPGKHETDFLGHTILDDDLEEGDNKALLFSDRGELLIEYLKVNLGNGEGTWIKGNDDGIPVAETRYGKIALVICRDLSFPRFMRQVGKAGVDIVLAPSYENVKSLAVSYSQMKRAVEYGFSLVRVNHYGLTIAVDSRGNILSTLNSFTTSREIMYADVPVKGRATLYTFLGDCIPLFSLVGICLFLIVSVFRKKKRS